PLSYGKVMPPMVGGIRFEHGHRLVAAAVSTLVGLEMALLLFFERRRSVKLLGGGAFVAILLPALLGGLTVLLLLPPIVSAAHAALAEIVFALAVTIALMCSTSWTRPSFEKQFPSDVAPLKHAFRASLVASLAIYGQILLGAAVRHTGAGLAV